MKRILLACLLVGHQSAYSLQQASKRLAQLAPQARQVLRPSLVRPISSASARLQSSGAARSRPIASIPEAASGYQDQSWRQQQSHSARPTFVDKALYTGALVGLGTLGYQNLVEYRKQSEREKLIQLEQEVATISQRMGEPLSGIMGIRDYDDFKDLMSKISEWPFSDQAIIFDMLYIRKNDEAVRFLQERMPEFLLRDYKESDRLGDRFVDLSSVPREHDENVKKWLLQHPDYVEHMLKFAKPDETWFKSLKKKIDDTGDELERLSGGRRLNRSLLIRLKMDPWPCGLVLAIIEKMEELAALMQQLEPLVKRNKFFTKTYVLKMFDELIQDSKFRPLILNCLKEIDNFMKVYPEENFYISLIPERYPHILKYLKIEQFKHKELLMLIRKNKEFSNTLKQISKFAHENKNISGVHLSRASEDFLAKASSLKVAPQFLAALHKEASLLKQGYICFYHGQQYGSALINDISNMLFNRLKGGSLPQDFFFKQLRPRDFDTVQGKKEQTVAKALRSRDLSTKGLSEDQGGDGRISVNLFAFGNRGLRGSDTLFYTAADTNVGWDWLSMGSLKALGIPEYILEKIKPKIMDHVNKSRAVYSSGCLILIAVPLAIVDNNVYTVVKGRRRAAIYDTRVAPIIGGNALQNISDIIDTLTQPGSEKTFRELDSFECAIPISLAGLQNPFSGIKLLKFDPTPSSAQAAEELRRERDALVDEIMVELEKSGKLDACRKRVRHFYALLPALASAGAKEIELPKL